MVHTQGGLWPPQESCYLRGVLGLAPALSKVSRLLSIMSRGGGGEEGGGGRGGVGGRWGGGGATSCIPCLFLVEEKLNQTFNQKMPHLNFGRRKEMLSHMNVHHLLLKKPTSVYTQRYQPVYFVRKM